MCACKHATHNGGAAVAAASYWRAWMALNDAAAVVFGSQLDARCSGNKCCNNNAHITTQGFYVSVYVGVIELYMDVNKFASTLFHY